MTTPAFLLRLMHYVPLSASLRLGAEDAEACTFANDLRKATLEGRLAAVWLHPANELAGMVSIAKGKPRVPPQVAIARALGLIKGASDYLFLWHAGSLALEFKSATGSLNQGQRDFRAWCEELGVPFQTIRSAGEGLAALRERGLLA